MHFRVSIFSFGKETSLAVLFLPFHQGQRSSRGGETVGSKRGLVREWGLGGTPSSLLSSLLHPLKRTSLAFRVNYFQHSLCQDQALPGWLRQYPEGLRESSRSDRVSRQDWPEDSTVTAGRKGPARGQEGRQSAHVK